MREAYDFSNGKRGAVAPIQPGATRINVCLDDDIIAWFRQQVEDASGGDYQALINQALREHVERQSGMDREA